VLGSEWLKKTAIPAKEKNCDTQQPEKKGEKTPPVTPPPPSKRAPKPKEYTTTYEVQLEVLKRSPGTQWGAKEGSAAKSLCQQISKRIQEGNPDKSEATKEEVMDQVRWLFDNLPEFYKTTFDITIIASKLNSIMNQLKQQQHAEPTNYYATVQPRAGSTARAALELAARNRRLLAE